MAKDSPSVLYHAPHLHVSKFIPEVVATDDTIAIFPSPLQIQQKCISVSLKNKTYICFLPYRIYGD